VHKKSEPQQVCEKKNLHSGKTNIEIAAGKGTMHEDLYISLYFLHVQPAMLVLPEFTTYLVVPKKINREKHIGRYKHHVKHHQLIMPTSTGRLQTAKSPK